VGVTCIYVYIYIYTYIYMAYLWVYVVCVYECMYAFICIYMYMYIYIPLLIHSRVQDTLCWYSAAAGRDNVWLRVCAPVEAMCNALLESSRETFDL